MADLNRQSPRAAIKQWLCNNAKKADWSDKDRLKLREQHQPRLSNENYSQKQSCEGIEVPQLHPRQRHPSKSTAVLAVEHPSQYEPNSTRQRDRISSVALHPDMQHPSSTSRRDTRLLYQRRHLSHGHRKKRRVVPSSQSTTLQPAATVDLKVQGYDVDTGPPAVDDDRGCMTDTLSTSSASIYSFSSYVSLRPTKTYEKRPRHKTRDDRYELKEVKKSRDRSVAKERPLRKAKKRRRKEKSGTALLQDFKAPNVSNDRLTVS